MVCFWLDNLVARGIRCEEFLCLFSLAQNPEVPQCGTTGIAGGIQFWKHLVRLEVG